MRPALFVLVALVAAACGDEKERRRFAQESAKEIQESVARYAKLPKLLESVPHYDGPSLAAPPRERLYFSGESGEAWKRMNGLVVHLEDLARVGEPDTVPFRIEGFDDGWSLPDLVAHFGRTAEWKGFFTDLKAAQSGLDRLHRARWALVIRTRTWRQVKSTGEHGFVPAYFEGDAVLVDAHTQTVLGGYPLEVQGHETLGVQTTKGPVKGMELRESLEHASDTQLKNLLGVAIASGLEALVPGSVPPYASSYYRKAKP